MAVIECNEINQIANELLMKFADCNKIKNEDLRTLVDLIIAVSTCTNGGPDYNTLETDIYEPISDEIITYPPDTFHSVSIVSTLGEFILNGATYPSGVTINIEYTSLNQQAFTFTAKAGSRVVVNYLIETI